MVSDKDVESVLRLLPRDAKYIFTQASVKRALPAETLRIQAENFGLDGTACPDVLAAYKKALEIAQRNDLIFIGGSCYVVADLLKGLFNKI